LGLESSLYTYHHEGHDDWLGLNEVHTPRLNLPPVIASLLESDSFAVSVPFHEEMEM
jgi:hypothetical protein